MGVRFSHLACNSTSAHCQLRYWLWYIVFTYSKPVFFNRGCAERQGSVSGCRGFRWNRPKFTTTVLYGCQKYKKNLSKIWKNIKNTKLWVGKGRLGNPSWCCWSGWSHWKSYNTTPDPLLLLLYSILFFHQWQKFFSSRSLETPYLANKLRILLLVANFANHDKFVFSWPAWAV